MLRFLHSSPSRLVSSASVGSRHPIGPCVTDQPASSDGKLDDFVAAYNFGRRLKNLTSYDFIPGPPCLRSALSAGQLRNPGPIGCRDAPAIESAPVASVKPTGLSVVKTGSLRTIEAVPQPVKPPGKPLVKAA